MMTSDNHINRPIALIGMRGCGKTVVGRELADLLGGEHVDTDDEIVQQAGKSIAEIFATEGETGFRAHERRVIEQVTKNPPMVISVGGGAVVDEQNVKRFAAVTTIVWLSAEAEVLWQRISVDPNSGQSRPRLTDKDGLEEIKVLLTERISIYEKISSMRVDTTGKTPDAIAQEIISGVS